MQNRGLQGVEEGRSSRGSNFFENSYHKGLDLEGHSSMSVPLGAYCIGVPDSGRTRVCRRDLDYQIPRQVFMSSISGSRGRLSFVVD